MPCGLLWILLYNLVLYADAICVWSIVVSWLIAHHPNCIVLGASVSLSAMFVLITFLTIPLCLVRIVSIRPQSGSLEFRVRSLFLFRARSARITWRKCSSNILLDPTREYPALINLKPWGQASNFAFRLSHMDVSRKGCIVVVINTDWPVFSQCKVSVPIGGRDVR